jgi:predicted nucleic acid-binding protein
MSRAPRMVLDTGVALFALHYLLTGDRDLLSIAGEFSRPIVTADRFLNVLAKS